MLALAPVAFVALCVAFNLRNIAYWDEFDTVLNYLVGLDAPEPWTTKLARLFAVQNEHRIFTSRLLFTVLYRLTGGVNFIVIGVVGNLFLVGLCGLLLERAGGFVRATRLAVILGLVVFQLQHHENLFWSGSSIDHFNVVLLAAAAFSGLTSGTPRGLLAALLFALLGTYTLAHGFMIWPVGAALLALHRRWRDLAWWGGVAGAAAACYFPGFFVNPDHHIEAAFNVGRVLRYWLTLIGATPACGELAVAPWLGACLLGAIAWLARGRVWREQPFMAALIAFCIGSLALVALGRTGVSEGFPVPSRYYILSALPWALTLWVAIEHGLAQQTCRPRCLVALAAALVAFNITSNVRFFDRGQEFAVGRERASQWFRYYHTIAGERFKLFPRAERADSIIKAAEERGIYRLPNLAPQVAVTNAREIGNATCFFDELTMDADNIYVRGWAFVPDRVPVPGELHVVLRGEKSFQVYKPLFVSRPDVAANHRNPRLAATGFRLTLPRRELPEENLTVGVLFERKGQPEFFMTEQQLALAPAPTAKTPSVAAATAGVTGAPVHGRGVLKPAEKRATARLPGSAQRITVAKPREIGNVTYFFDEVKMDAKNIYVRGWAFVPQRDPVPDELHIVFRSQRTFQVYPAVTLPRPDVANSFHNPHLTSCGFKLTLPRRELPNEDLSVGVLFKRGAEAEFIMTAHRLALAPDTGNRTQLLTDD